MCGITGFISRDRETDVGPRRELLGRMCEVIRHRGPDEGGLMVEGRAALGMRRLSIIDLKSGQQPIFSNDRRYAIVFNGEIYNFRELRSELEGRGHEFRTNSDTEVILRAYEAMGPRCLDRLRGMFAFAVWDALEESLFLARDRVGKKPLFYSLTPGGDLVFGSELKTLIEHGGISREVDTAALDAYLSFGYVPEELCIFRGVKKLLPGHHLVFKGGRIQTERYWDFRPSDAHSATESDIIEELREKIRDAVRVRLVSDVPLGAFLSGGADSSSVVAMMAELSSSPVKTFSIGFDEEQFDERGYARLAAKRYGTDHHEFVVTPDLFDLADKVAWHFDEPFADPSSLPTYLLSKMTKDHVTVALSGDGGDELFAGYTRYAIQQRRDTATAIPTALREGIIRRASRFLPHGAPGKNFLYNVSLDPIGRYIDSVSHFNGPRRNMLYSAAMREKLNGEMEAGEELFRSIAASSGTADPLGTLLYLDGRTYLPGDILTKVDRMSMAASLETRSPLLDHELIEFTAAIPSALKLNGGRTKYIFKKAMEGIVPNEILYREKQGFGVPIGRWINHQLNERVREDLTGPRAIERGYFDQAYVKRLLAEHGSGRRDHAYSIWVLWMLELWHRKFVDGGAAG